MELPFEKLGQQLTVLSYGIGQDSTAILVKLIEDPIFYREYVKGKLIVVSADTLNEHDTTNNFVTYIRDICDKNDIPFYHLDPAVWCTGHWKNGLTGFYKANTAIGSKAYPKSCSDNLKIRPIYRFLEHYVHNTFETKNYGRKAAFYEYEKMYGKIRVLLGISSEEEKKRVSKEKTGIKWFDTCIEKVYPLIQEQWDRQACQNIIAMHGYEVPFPSNCKLCPFMSLQELLYMHRYMPKDYDLLVKLEAAKLKKHEDLGDKNLGVWGTTKPIPEMLKEAIEKYGHWTKEELEDYKFSHGHCVMSKF